MTETWRPVVGFEHLYRVSDLGRVKSIDRVTPQIHFASGKLMLVPRRGVILKQVWSEGYAQVTLFTEAKEQRIQKVHQLVAEAFIGPRPPGLLVRHLDGNSRRNHADNLAYGTVRDNTNDMLAHGTQAKGEKVSTAKLDEESVDYIRAMRGRIRQVDLAKQLGVGQSQISAIQLGKSWRHV